ncbi:DivIVA domain-containing protein [Actinomadura bangladeshensis]|uniref:DivIVA domain-containing protein n=1 Tax=Actinomadura bangladeshensis TaxID=453573 RepID=A0A4R4N3F2_9ACTN|nr:DivIVA domain-containing protein [Actinomadura bangladeshensis]TDC03175.1 DivIVA domain-containing protein [Actinomadura bangladeshensis]
MRTGARLPVALRGYDRKQVDTLLQRISQTLDGGPPVSAEEVRGTRFDIVLRGYDSRAVDELLRECLRELQARAPIAERPGRPRAQPAWLINWIQNARFSGAGLRSGYDVRDVDAFLDRVVAGLRGTAPAVSARDVRESAFRVVRLGPGYDEQEVDRFLVQLAGALER